jgi:uncharacterized protein
LKFGGGGTIVEWAVHLRRFDENRTLDRLAERHELNLEIIAKLAGVIASAHRRAPVVTGANGGKALHRQVEETLATQCNKPSRGSPRCFRSAKIKVKSVAVMVIFTCATSC